MTRVACWVQNASGGTGRIPIVAGLCGGPHWSFNAAMCAFCSAQDDSYFITSIRLLVRLFI